MHDSIRDDAWRVGDCWGTGDGALTGRDRLGSWALPALSEAITLQITYVR